MAAIAKAKVFTDGQDQVVHIPSQFHLASDEVLIHRDAASGDLILSAATGPWADVFSALDQAGIPDDFLADRQQQMPQVRTDL